MEIVKKTLSETHRECFVETDASMSTWSISSHIWKSVSYENHSSSREKLVGQLIFSNTCDFKKHFEIIHRFNPPPKKRTLKILYVEQAQ